MQGLLDRWYEGVRSSSPEILSEITTDDVVLSWNGDRETIPWAGVHRGRAAVLGFFSTLGALVEVVNVTTFDRIEAPGATVIILEGRWRVRASGRTIEARACNVFRFRDGRISAYEVYNDSGRFADALAK